MLRLIDTPQAHAYADELLCRHVNALVSQVRADLLSALDRVAPRTDSGGMKLDEVVLYVSDGSAPGEKRARGDAMTAAQARQLCLGPPPPAADPRPNGVTFGTGGMQTGPLSPATMAPEPTPQAPGHVHPPQGVAPALAGYLLGPLGALRVLVVLERQWFLARAPWPFVQALRARGLGSAA